MKRLSTIVLMSLVGVALLHAQVTFRFSGGISNEQLKQNVERNVSALLSEINNAESAGRCLDFAGIRITETARGGLSSLWANLRFRCEWKTNVQNCLRDVQEFEIRQIPVEMKPLDNTYKGEIHKELTVSFNRNGMITGVRTAMDNNSYMSLMAGGMSVKDVRMRREILKFVEDFRSYYDEKNLSAIDEIFSDNALIITGRVLRKDLTSQSNADIRIPGKNIIFNKQTKTQYINNLRNVFRVNRYIKVDFSDIELIRHSSRENIYGVRLRQRWNSQRYNGGTYMDDGYVFLLWDFNDEEHPKIYVRSWSPVSGEVSSDNLLAPDDFDGL